MLYKCPYSLMGAHTLSWDYSFVFGYLLLGKSLHLSNDGTK